MAKLKNPLLGLGVQGTLGDSVTFQKFMSRDTARKKPIPSDPYSLAQAYHRWLYRDYLALWDTLSPAEKWAYRQAGGLKKNTALGEFMRPRLGLMPDLAGVWHLDEASGAVAHDVTPNANNGAFIGCVSVPAVISRGRWFDGVNDSIHVPTSPSLDLTGEFTVMCIIRPLNLDNVGTFVSKANLADRSWWIQYRNITGELKMQNYDSTGAWQSDLYGLFLTLAWHHVAVVFIPTVSITVYLDGAGVTKPTALIDTRVTASDLRIGSNWPGAAHCRAIIDEVRLYNRALTQAEVTQHVERSYPS